MRLGIDARLFHVNTGIGRYTRSLFFEYLQRRQQSDDQIVLFYDRPSDLASFFPDAFASASSLPEHVRLVTALCRRRIVWTNWSLPPLLRQQQIDVYHGVCNFELPLRKMCRYVVTIHDLVPLFFPELVPKKHLLFFKLFIKRAAQTADAIITDSEHSKQDICRYLKVSDEKVRVIHLGYTPQPLPQNAEEQRQRLFKQYGIRQPYLLFVGVIEPKKNLERLLEAFALLRQERRIDDSVQLVIAGGKGWFCERIEHNIAALRLETSVVLTGFMPDDALPLLYSGADAFVFPSIYEGFGLPVVEAMSHGVPVITSNVSSLPEIAGHAGLLVNPMDTASIAAGIETVLTHPEQRESMKIAGRLQARQFSWPRTAEATYRVYQDVFQG